MATRPKSGITADTDVNLDFLTKEEKEALLSKKMDMIRQRNKMINERHEVIEADRRKAVESGNAVKALDSKTLPAEGAPNKSRGRGRGKGEGSHNNKPAKDRPRSHGDTSYEPIVDVSDFTVHRNDNRHNNKGRGGQHQHQHQHGDRDRDAPTSTPKHKRRPHPKEENPPPDPSFNPLSDWRRSGSDKKEGSEHKRHPRTYGGGADLARVKDNMKTMREKEKERPGTSRPLEIVMTGRERKNHEQWKQERERYDNERIQRQMGDSGGWKREWDHDKIALEYDDHPHSRMEPAKRPAGRIGSGRFDRGDRESWPKAPAREGKGGANQKPQSPQSTTAPPPRHHKPQQQHQQPPPLSPQQSQLSPQSPPPPSQQQQPTQSLQGVDSTKTARAGKGRGRGRGRGRGAGSGGQVGGSPVDRPRTWSGGDDRFVECQKEMLVVKFDNTAGDNTVEVEYDDEAMLSPTPSSKSSNSTQGRGSSSNNQPPRSKGGRNPNQKHHDKMASKGKIGSGRISGHHNQQHQHQQHDKDRFVDAEWETPSVNHRHSYDGSKIRTSSHSQSQGDSEEWEDCTESSGVPDEDGSTDMNHANLHLDCQLNPEAPEFLPTSPDFLKTPPGHVKVMNWAGSNSPTSPHSNLSQPSLSSPSPRQPPEVASSQSTLSSPGSSVSTRAKNRREEMDMMPEPDAPMPPPFLLQAEQSTAVVEDKEERNLDVLENGNQNEENHDGDDEGDDEDEDDDDNEGFEDSVDNIPDDNGKENNENPEEAPKEEENEEKRPANSEDSEAGDADVKGLSSDSTDVASHQPIVNGHTSEDVASSSSPNTEESGEKLEQPEEVSQLQCGEENSESNDSVTISTESGEERQPTTSLDPGKTDLIEDETDLLTVENGSKSAVDADEDQAISTDILIESKTDSSEPTAEISADS